MTGPLAALKWAPARGVFTSFDRSTSAKADYFAPDRHSFWDESASLGRGAVSRGAGLSYAAATFREGGQMVDHSRFNRFLDFDSKTCTIDVEAGATLGDIFAFAAPRNLYLAVQPGHPSITVGGCIGADVHGKNQFRDGTFISRVESIRLFHPAHGILDVGPDRDADLFRLSCGGYGLTGNVLSARLRLSPTPAPRVAVEVVPLDEIERLPETLQGLGEQSDLLYSWHDFTARGRRFGAGFVVTGTFDRSASLESGGGVRSFRSTDSPLSRHLPISLWNGWTTPVFNRLFNAVSRRWSSNPSLPLYDFLFPVARRVSYFHFFGRSGFHEYQLVLPVSGFPKFVNGIRDYLSRRPLPISLASAKLFRGERELLRFTGDGICLAIDLPRIKGSDAFLKVVDGLMEECGGWPNLIKDSRLSADTVARTYPEYETFRQRLLQFDPRRLYRSELSDRLGL